jgi:hypothetical protein
VATLKQICNLYEIPLPPKSYWSLKPENRGLRISPL